MKIAVFVMAIMVMCICPGRISEEKDLVLGEQRRRPKDCRSPKGKHGTVQNDGCIQSTCTNGKWKPKMKTDICCYKQQVHKPNTVLDTIVSADNCSSTTIGCGAVGELEFNHKSCSDPATKQQVEQLEVNLEKQIEGIENVTETIDKQGEDIYKTVKEVDKKIIIIENKVDDLKNTTNWQSEKLNNVIQKIENNKKSIENNVDDLSRKIENQTEKIAEKIQDINKSIEHNSDDLSDKINNVVHKIEKNKISIENNVDDLSRKLETQTEKIGEKIQNMNISIENNSDDLSDKMNNVAQKIENNKISIENQTEKIAEKIQNMNISIENNSDDLSDKMNNVVQKIENSKLSIENQTEKIAEKIQNINISIEHNSVDLSDKINNVVQKIENNKISIESHVNDLSNKMNNVVQKIENNKISIENQTEKIAEKIQNMNIQAEKIEEKIEDLTNNMESLSQMVKDNIGDQTEMSLQMMRTLANLTQLMEKHSEDTPMVEGVLITGGVEAQTSTELFLPHTGKTCSLQSLPDNRFAHSLDVIGNKVILCGGQSSQTSCLQFLATSSTGSWVHYATLAQSRYKHTSHVFKDDLRLIGGSGSPGTTEIIRKGNQYNLQQDSDWACSIPDQSSFIITSGLSSSGSRYVKTVARYNMQGFVENLPDLAQARIGHGCGSYINEWNVKVLVVAGGRYGPNSYLSSTEVLTSGATSWTSGESLPHGIYGYVASVNMDSYILLIGGANIGGRSRAILKFNGRWTEVGKMKNARYHARATKIEIPGPGGLLDINGCY